MYHNTTHLSSVLGLRGTFAVLFGLMALLWPGMTAVTLVLLFGAYAFTDGVLALLASSHATKRKRLWVPLLAEGVIGVCIGTMAFFWPTDTALALLVLIAAWAVLTGMFEILAAIELRRIVADNWLTGLSGVASALCGALLLLFPQEGALALVWFLGGYALLYGVFLLALAFRLQERHPHRHIPLQR